MRGGRHKADARGSALFTDRSAKLLICWSSQSYDGRGGVCASRSWYGSFGAHPQLSARTGAIAGCEQNLLFQQVKNFLTVTLLSLGNPMLAMGDEV